jgi:malate dehydrogenase (oxaloacetate-decarboxylating)
MELHNFRRLVVTEDGKVVGILAQRFTLEEELEELLGKADFPSKEALRLHPYYRGKIEVIPKVPINSYSDFAIWYTPGVAASSKAIKEKPELVYEHTNKWNSVAIVTDGTRVLGLGDVGPEPALAVMEGKALLYKYLGGVDAFPICISSVNKEEIVETVKRIHPSFGAVNLEDISQPKCFWILDKLRKELPVPGLAR